jgi:uncharacterized protein (DUF362 family)
MAKSVVSIVKGTDPEKLVAEALELLGGVSSLIRQDSTVVIKPNAGHPMPPQSSVNTNPALVAAIIKEVRKASPRQIILAEAAAIGCDTLQCLEVSGIGKAAEDAGVDKIIDIKRDKDLIKVPIRDARCENIHNVLLPRFLIEADHIINVPIFKSHVAMVYTCALKNMKGVVQDKVHYQMHQTNLAEAIMDLWSVCRADLQIADLIRPAEGYGPHTPLPMDFGCLIAGKDPVAVDATACRVLGVDVAKVPYFGPAVARSLGTFNEKQIDVRGKQIKEVFKQMWLPYMGGFEQWPEYHIHAENACSSCQALLAFTMEKLKALGEYDKNAGIHIVAGKTSKLPENVDPEDLILVGDCVKKFKGKGFWACGCPPTEPLPLWEIIDRREMNDLTLGFDGRARMGKEQPFMDAYMKQKKAEYDKKLAAEASKGKKEAKPDKK